MKVGIFGGSFNPIHLGHVGIARYVLQAGRVEQVWLMVSPLNPLKRDVAATLIDTSDRLKMAELATADCPHILVSDFETRLPLPSYTYNTLQALGRQYPEHEFTLMIGEDNLQRFSQWYRADDIKARYDIITYPRRLEGKTGEVDATLQLFDISSTEIRKAIAEGRWAEAEAWLHPDVIRYIQRHGLYQHEVRD